MSHPVRAVARVVVLDANGSVLLVRYTDSRPGRPSSYWVTPGGALEHGETHRAAAARELREETGLEGEIGQELWERAFHADYGYGSVHQVERYFLVKVDAVSPWVANSSPEPIREHRWWPLAELDTTREIIFPEELATSVLKILNGPKGD